MFKNIHIKNFRGIKNLKIEKLNQINLIVGKNNCGKSTILESLFLLVGASNPELPLKINTFRNYILVDEHFWRLFFFDLNLNKEIQISGNLQKPNENRELTINPLFSDELDIEENNYSKDVLEKPKSADSKICLDSSKSLLGLNCKFNSSLQKKRETIKSKIRQFPDGSVKHQMNNTYEEKLKGIFINSNLIYTDIAQKFHDIQLSKKVDLVVSILKEIEPSITGLSLGVHDTIYCDVGKSQLLPVNVMGDGLIRLLAITMTILSGENKFVFIDEIENGFHYSSQKILWKAILKITQLTNTQIFCTTHSLENIQALTNCLTEKKDSSKISMFRVEKDNSKFRTITFNEESLKNSFESNWEIR